VPLCDRPWQLRHLRCLGLLPLAALGLSLPALAQRSCLDGQLILPEGAVADALADVSRSTQPADLELDRWPAWSSSAPEAGWNTEPPWRRWVELVRAEAATEEPDPGRRAQLAALARLQGRDGDAWRHLVACAGDPSTLRALVPLFLPGVEPRELGTRPLPDNVLLSPALPPAVAEPRGRLRGLVGRQATVRGVRVGDALLSLAVVIEADGVQVDVTHLEGPPVRVRVRPPVPPGVEIGLLYADWERCDEPHAPVTLELSQSEEGQKRAVWGRFQPREERWPAPEPAADLPRLRAPIVIVGPDEAAPRLARFCESLEELFGLPCSLRSSATADTPTFFEPTRMHLGTQESPERDSERKLRAMISLAERWALAGAARSQ